MRVWPVSDDAIRDGKVRIEGSDAKHIAKVLRRGVGDRLKVSNSGSRVYETEIEEVSADFIIANIIGRIEADIKKPDLLIAISLCKQSVMELVAQKSVELGCREFQPVITGRSISKALSPSKLERLQRIVHEASKQCGNANPLTVNDPVSLAELSPSDAGIVLWEEEKSKTLKTVLETIGEPHSLTLLIGPPGGFEKTEIETLRSRGFIAAGMGNLIMRTETAAIALLSVVNYHFGKLEP